MDFGVFLGFLPDLSRKRLRLWRSENRPPNGHQMGLYARARARARVGAASCVPVNYPMATPDGWPSPPRPGLAGIAGQLARERSRVRAASCPITAIREAARGKARSAATNRPGRPAKRGRTGRGKARRPRSRRRRTHGRQAARIARHAHRGAAVPPKGDAGGLPSPSPSAIVSAFPQQGGPLRAQEGEGFGEGEGNRARKGARARPTRPTKRNATGNAGRRRRAARPGQSAGAAHAAVDADRQAKEPGAATARQRIGRAANGHPRSRPGPTGAESGRAQPGRALGARRRSVQPCNALGLGAARTERGGAAGRNPSPALCAPL